RGLSRERWGDRGPRTTDPALLAQAPLSPQVRRDIQRLESEALDPWPAASSDDKKARLLRTTYADLLTRNLRLDPGVVPYYQNWPHGLFGVGIDAVSALDAWGLGFPGFQGMRLEPGFLRGMNRDTMRIPEADENYFHFPDGNATVARLLVRRLVPGAIPGSTASDVVLARANYAKLDEPGHPVRLRLNSTVVRVRHVGGPLNAREVEILYVRGGRLCRVRAKHCILACWSTVIPYLCPEMSTQQKEALAYEVKVPLVYANVLVRRWTAFRELGVSGVSCLGSYWRSFHLDFPVRVGEYECSRDPEGPIVVNFSKTPCAPGLPARDQHRAGSIELLGTSFEDMERQIRDLLDRALGPAGFDPARDVLAITANRWPHGYAYQYNALFDPFWVEGTEEPCVRARRPFGRVFVANSDADAYAYTDSAINQGHRAVQELLRSGTTTVGDGPLTPRRVARRTS
ncbi:MAG TPA: NAD(P)/FAD-dependent oxidoreductase, partial [Vicinamibacteria bacterium]